jgi:hypothetical protein
VYACRGRKLYFRDCVVWLSGNCGCGCQDCRKHARKYICVTLQHNTVHPCRTIYSSLTSPAVSNCPVAQPKSNGLVPVSSTCIRTAYYRSHILLHRSRNIGISILPAAPEPPSDKGSLSKKHPTGKPQKNNPRMATAPLYSVYLSRFYCCP